MKYKLFGPNEGKDIVLGGFKFEKGELRIQDADVAAVEPIITRFYGAVRETDFNALKTQAQAEAKARTDAEAKARAEAEAREKADNKQK